MKKLLLLILPILLFSCSNSSVDDSNTITYPKPEKGNLSVPSFTVTNPQYRREGDYLYFDFVQFEGDIKGFTKIDHNVFKANETKDYSLEMTVKGNIKYNIQGKPFPFPYSLVIKIGDLQHVINSAVDDTDNPNKELKLNLKQDDTISFQILGTSLYGDVLEITNTYLEINFQELSSGQADFSSALDGFALKDFVKE